MKKARIKIKTSAHKPHVGKTFHHIITFLGQGSLHWITLLIFTGAMMLVCKVLPLPTPQVHEEIRKPGEGNGLLKTEGTPIQT